MPNIYIFRDTGNINYLIFFDFRMVLVGPTLAHGWCSSKDMRGISIRGPKRKRDNTKVSLCTNYKTGHRMGVIWEGGGQIIMPHRQITA
jgi:hypothetical protein